jgi:hypothetical protein
VSSHSALAPDLLPVNEAQTVVSGLGTVRLWHPAPTVFVVRVEGNLTEAISRAINAAGRRIVATDRRLAVFQDFELMTGYDRPARQELTRGGMELRKYVDMSHFLVRARIVALGVQIANIVLGNLKVHPTRAAFENLLRSTVQDRLRADSVHF